MIGVAVSQDQRFQPIDALLPEIPCDIPGVEARACVEQDIAGSRHIDQHRVSLPHVEDVHDHPCVSGRNAKVVASARTAAIATSFRSRPRVTRIPTRAPYQHAIQSAEGDRINECPPGISAVQFTHANISEMKIRFAWLKISARNKDTEPATSDRTPVSRTRDEIGMTSRFPSRATGDTTLNAYADSGVVTSQAAADATTSDAASMPHDRPHRFQNGAG